VLEAGSSVVGRTCLDRGACMCLAPCLFNPCKLIDKFTICCCIAMLNTGMDMSTLCTLVWIKISNDNIGIDMSTLHILVWIN
jgi:hypothetical protein